jgi:hypothetical protein
MRNPLIYMARPARFERATAWFVALRAIVSFQWLRSISFGQNSPVDPAYYAGLRKSFGHFFGYFLLPFLLVFPASSQAFTVYNKGHVFDQFIEMSLSPCGAPFFEVENVPVAENPRLIVALANYFMHENFRYTSDGISDTWCADHDTTQYWEGDCDDFAFTAAVMLAKGGIPRNNIFLATVLTWEGRLKNLAYPDYHPNRMVADHIVVIVWANGRNWVIDNASNKVLPIEEVFNDLGYVAHGIISYGNYGAGKANHAERGFRRFWQ